MSLATPSKIRELQIKLYRKAKNEPGYRFYMNEAKTSIKQARTESFNFLGYTFGPHRYKKDGHWYLGASPGLARRRKAWRVSKKKWETSWYPVTSGRGRKYGIRSIRFYGAGPHTSATERERRHTGRSTITSINVCSSSCGDATKCSRAAPTASEMTWYLASWAYSGSVMFSWGLVRESTVKPVGKPDARCGLQKYVAF